MKTYYLKPNLSAPESEKLIYVARNGQGYFANNELHLQGEHFKRSHRLCLMKNALLVF